MVTKGATLAIQLRRGDYTDFDPSQLLDGELAIVLENDPNTDDGTGTYVSYGDSNVKRLLHADESVDVPIASSETAGIVKPDGETITVDEDGILSVAGGGTNADWNENDSSSFAYIENRPFYSIESTYNVLNATTFGGDYADAEASGFALVAENVALLSDITAGNLYRMTVSSQEYDVTATQREITVRGPYGSKTLTGPGLYVSGACQIIRTASKTAAVLLPGSVGQYEVPAKSVAIIGVNESITTMPTKYLPDATTSNNGAMSAADKVKLNGIATGATKNTPSSTAPVMDGAASAGSSTNYARADHVHPTDTSRAAASDLTDHVDDTTVHITSAERTSWNGKADESDLTAHTGSTSIHVTTSDKARWNGKADAYPATSSTIGLVKPDGTSTTVDADGTFHAAAGTPATENTPGIVKPDNQTIFVDNGVLYAAWAGEGVNGWPGIVQPDGETLSIGDDNIMRVPYASSGQYGVVMPDGDTTKVDGNGYLYVPVADSSYPGIVKPDGETVDVDSNGTLSVIGVGGIPEPSSATPQMDGMGGSPGSSDAYARGDHVHPTDTSRASASDLTSHTSDSTAHVTAAERTTWNAKASTTTATTSANGLMSASDKSKLDGIESGANAYELPAATTSTLGGVKADGTTILVDADGTIHGAGELSVSVTADGNSVSGATIVVREGSASGAVVAEYPYSGTPVTIRLPMGYHYCVTASDDLRMYGPPVPVTGVVGMLTQSITVTYSALESVLEKADGVYTNESISEYLRRTRTGDVYGVSEPLTAAVALTKTDANADLAAPTPGYIGTPAIDPYDNLGPFLFRVCNGSVDADGVPHVTAIEGIDSDFERDGSNGNVWQMHGIIYESWETTETANLHKITDTPREGYQPHDQCTLPDGTMRPYMLTAVYPLGKNPFDNDSPASISGVAPRTRDVSHNSGITICSTASTGYSLKSTYDDWYIKTMFEMKYATKHSQSVYAGCTSYSLQYNPAVAETGVKRVIVTNAQAANFVIGSNCQFGTRTGASDNDRNRAQNFDIFDKVTITSIEAYDTNNSAINFDAPNTFDSATTCLLSTAPWNCGCLDAVVGDGTLSVAGRTNGKEPFKIQGIEVAHGMYEVLGNVIISNDGSTGWTPYVCADTRNAATSVTANYTACDHALPTNDADGWKYPAHTVYSNGLRYGADMSASSSTGLNDGTYTNKLATTGVREWLGLGPLSNGSTAGLWCVYGNSGLSSVHWLIGSRLSGTGRAAA